MRFRIYGDDGIYLNNGRVFHSIKEAIDTLASFHSVDFDDEKYKDIYEWLNEFKTKQEKFEQLLEWGQWHREDLNKEEK